MTLQGWMEKFYDVFVAFVYDYWILLAVGFAALIIILNLIHIIIKRKDGEAVQKYSKAIFYQLQILALVIAALVIFLFVIGKYTI